jgi:hypothetical protein
LVLDRSIAVTIPKANLVKLKGWISGLYVGSLYEGIKGTDFETGGIQFLRHSCIVKTDPAG